MQKLKLGFEEGQIVKNEYKAGDMIREVSQGLQ